MPTPYLIALALLLGWSVAVADDHLERCASLSKITIPATQDTVHFYQGQVRRHGEKRVSDAVAFYLVPGQAHGHGSFRATGSMPLYQCWRSGSAKESRQAHSPQQIPTKSHRGALDPCAGIPPGQSMMEKVTLTVLRISVACLHCRIQLDGTHTRSLIAFDHTV